jgi:hypothetical protein
LTSDELGGRYGRFHPNAGSDKSSIMANDTHRPLRPAPAWFHSGTLWPASLLIAIAVFAFLRAGGSADFGGSRLVVLVVEMWPISVALMTLAIGGTLRTLKLFLDATADPAESHTGPELNSRTELNPRPEPQPGH